MLDLILFRNKSFGCFWSFRVNLEAVTGESGATFYMVKVSLRIRNFVEVLVRIWISAKHEHWRQWEVLPFSHGNTRKVARRYIIPASWSRRECMKKLMLPLLPVITTQFANCCVFLFCVRV